MKRNASKNRAAQQQRAGIIAKIIGEEPEWKNTLLNTQKKLSTLAKETIQSLLHKKLRQTFTTSLLP